MNWLSHHLAAHAVALRDGNLVQLGVLLAADVLILFSVASLAVAIERGLALSRARKIEESEYALLRDGWRQNSPALMNRLAQSGAPSARAVQAGLDLLHDLQSPGQIPGQSPGQSPGSPRAASPATARELAREAMAQGLEVQSAALSRNLSVLATVASTAPYIGLFGTVLGILSAFARIAATGQTGASVVAAPIAEALTATGLGLGVAIPAVMAYNALSGRVSDLMLRVETHALDLSARLIGSEAAHPVGPVGGPANGMAASVEIAKAAAPSTLGASGAAGEAGHAR